ncbi:MAG TPA: hypothetical protein VN751_00960 [Solirubrobacteraceae bacterium]|jgi:hypothetical protein|nr:hypothetical protein [Solirubrobacteraceae bacterium]
MAGGDYASISPGDDRLSVPDDGLAAYEHIEHLCGEEEALLKIPAEEREAHHHRRLEALGHELDRVFARLRRRAETRRS